MASNSLNIETIEKKVSADKAYSIPDSVSILEDHNFHKEMEITVQKWLAEEVLFDDFISCDGVNLRYYFKVPEKSKAVIVIVHGFCEFWGKYHEMAWYLDQAGYGFFFIEQRGHGYSHREVEPLDFVHIDNYNQYVEDLHRFMEQVVMPTVNGRHIYLYANSMGGAVGALFLEQYPEYFEKAVFNSPMLDINTGNLPKPIIHTYMLCMKVARKMKEPAANQKHFSGKANFESSGCLSKMRYDYQFEQRLANKNYQTNGGTFGWISASLAAERKALYDATKIQIPILMFIAGRDHLVNPEGQLIFAKKSANTKIVKFEEAKHEIFNSHPSILIDYYGRIFDFFK